MKLITTIFGSSLPQRGSREYATAYECGKQLAGIGMTVCNGGYGGTMEASAKGAREAGGKTLGVTVSTWSRSANAWIQEEVKTASLLERLTKLVELGSAYVVLPGGSGTLLELACVLEMINKGIIGRKPILLVGDYWDGLVETLHNEPGLAGRADCTHLLHKVRDAEELAAYLEAALGLSQDQG